MHCGSAGVIVGMRRSLVIAQSEERTTDGTEHHLGECVDKKVQEAVFRA